MHTRLPADMVLVMVGRAALALGRNNHSSGVDFSVDLDKIITNCSLSWSNAELGEIIQHDDNRVTEDGAEAVALAVAHRHRGWRVIRRMQREEHADWLLEDKTKKGRQIVAL